MEIIFLKKTLFLLRTTTVVRSFFMKKFIFLLVLLVTFGCAKEEQWVVHQGMIVQLQYDPIAIGTIDEDDRFWLDAIKVSHKKKEVSATKNSIVLPTSTYVVTKIKDRPFMDRSNPIGYALRLYNALLSYNQAYQITKLPLLQTQGILTLHSKTEQPIRLKMPPDYPLIVKVIKE